MFKELENILTPEHATAGAATFRYDTTLTRVINPRAISAARTRFGFPGAATRPWNSGFWAQLQYRLSPQGQPMLLQISR